GRVFTIFTRQGQQQPHDYSPWKKAVIPLDSFQLKGEFSVIFTGLQTNGMYSEMALDDILITDSCLFDTATAGFQASLDTAVRTAITYRFTALDSGARRYIWDFGDGQTDTSTLPSISHSYTQDSLYTVSLTVEDDCNTARRSQSDTLTVRGIGSKEYPLPRARLAIYPNPAQERVTIEAPLPQASTLRIYNVQGQLVRTLKMTGGKAVVPIQRLTKGLYLVRVQGQQGKFMVQ
ncbi:MAG: PKD domain-containing protein, partial [Schleiferiaceae bacterium]|nr:PKD domain-containing protein [Schleiferiaceae bacterium]